MLGDAFTMSTVAFVCVGLAILVYVKTWLKCSILALRLKGPPALPLVGNALIIADSSQMEYLAKCCSQLYGKLFRIWISIIPIIFVLEPKDIQSIIGSTKHNDKNFFYALMHNFIGEGLISNNGEKWKMNRKLIQPHFHVNILELYVSSFWKSASRQVEKLRNAKDINVNSYVNNCVLDILHESILGIPLEDVQAKEKSPFRNGVVTMPIRIQKPWFLLDRLYKFTAIAQNELSQKSKLHDFTRKIMDQKREEYLKNDHTHSLLRIFLEISENNPQFTEEEIVNEICTFMLAGQDSVAAAVAFGLHCFAQNADVQKKIIEELDDIFQGSERPVEASDLRKMRYLEQCIKETLRLYPSVPIFARKLTEDVVIGDVVKKCAPGVVYIEIQDPKRLDPESGEPLIVSNGSGFVIKEDGWILTNAHVVINKPRAIIRVKMHDGSVYNATVEDADMNIDLALIKVNSNKPLPALQFARPDDLTVGEWVVALGSPLSLSHSVTAGIISSVSRAASELGLRNHDMQYIQTDASITFGNSGGPLVNLDGDVIGINNLRITAGISFAIPITYATKFLDNGRHPLSKNGGIQEIEFRKNLGMTTVPLTESILDDVFELHKQIPENDKEFVHGVLVFKVVTDSIASRSGILPGDIITHIDGCCVQSSIDIYNNLTIQNRGSVVIDVLRNGEKQELKLLMKPN